MDDVYSYTGCLSTSNTKLQSQVSTAAVSAPFLMLMATQVMEKPIVQMVHSRFRPRRLWMVGSCDRSSCGADRQRFVTISRACSRNIRCNCCRRQSGSA